MIFFAICEDRSLFEDLHDLDKDRKQGHQLLGGQSAAALLLRACTEEAAEDVGRIQSAALLRFASLHKGDKIRQLESVCKGILLCLNLRSLCRREVEQGSQIQSAAGLIAGNQR